MQLPDKCVAGQDGRDLGAGADVRALALIRETLAWHDGLADFAFAMQGLGSGAISLAGSHEIKHRYLPRVAAGEAIAAFALSAAIVRNRGRGGTGCSAI